MLLLLPNNIERDESSVDEPAEPVVPVLLFARPFNVFSRVFSKVRNWLLTEVALPVLLVVLVLLLESDEESSLPEEAW